MLLVGSILVMDRKVLLGATARYMPTILGSQVFALGFCMLAGLVTGYGIPEALFDIGAPCMSGGSGGAMTTLPALYFQSFRYRYDSYGRKIPLLCIYRKRTGCCTGSYRRFCEAAKMKGLNGNGEILCSKKAQAQKTEEEGQKRPGTSADSHVALGSGIFMSFCLYLLGNILWKSSWFRCDPRSGMDHYPWHHH